MKAKYFLLGFLLLTMFAFSGMVRAADYEIGFEEDDEFIWDCTICNEEEMEDIFTKDWDAEGVSEDIEKGKKMKIVITETNDDLKGYSSVTGKNETALGVKFDWWTWTDNGDDWGDEDYEDVGYYLLADPDHYPEIYFVTLIPFPWFPIPVEEYLDELDLYKWYDVDGNKLTCEIDEGELEEGYPEEDFTMEATYNDKGIMSKMIIFNDDDEVILKAVISGIIPGYELPILLGVAAISTIGLIYLYKKKRI